jgi:hypothetical protein
MKAEEAPLTGEPHRRVEVGLRLALARLEEAAVACESLDSEHGSQIHKLILAVGSSHEAWLAKKQVDLRKTEFRFPSRD